MSDGRALRVLFTGGAGAGGEAIYRLLEGGYQVHLADATPGGIAPVVPAGRRHSLPMAGSAGFAGALEKLCRELAIDLLVPAVDEELELAATLSGPRVLLPTVQFIAAMLDKLAFVRHLQEAGLPVPETGTAEQWREARWTGRDLIVKPRSGRGSRHVHVLSSAAQVPAYLALTGLEPAQALIQQRIHGQEYTVQMAADGQGHLRAVVPVCVAHKRGVTLHAHTRHDVAVIQACQAIHAAWPVPGCYNIQLMLDSDGVAWPFEINPRISTTFCLAVAAGIDPLAIFLNDAQPPTSGLLPFTAGLVLRRYWSNHITGSAANIGGAGP